MSLQGRSTRPVGNRAGSRTAAGRVVGAGWLRRWRRWGLLLAACVIVGTVFTAVSLLPPASAQAQEEEEPDETSEADAGSADAGSDAGSGDSGSSDSGSGEGGGDEGSGGDGGSDAGSGEPSGLSAAEEAQRKRGSNSRRDAVVDFAGVAEEARNAMPNIHEARRDGKIAPSCAFDAVELRVLQSLRARRAELDKRELDLRGREEGLRAMEADFLSRATQVSQDVMRLESYLNIGEAGQLAEEEKLRTMVGAVGSLSARKAAPMLESVPPALAARLLRRLGPERSGALLAQMAPERAALLIERIAGETPVPAKAGGSRRRRGKGKGGK